MSDITQSSAAQIADAVKKGEVTAEAVANAHLSRIDTLEPTVKAFLAVTKDLALEQARAVDAKRKAGKPLGALAGVPVALKDNLQLTGVETTCASKILKGHIAAYDGTAVARWDPLESTCRHASLSIL